MSLKISLPVFVKNSWDFDRYCVESVDQLRRIVTLTLLSLPLYENDIFLFTETLFQQFCGSQCAILALLLLKLFLIILFFLMLLQMKLKKYVWVMQC